METKMSAIKERLLFKKHLAAFASDNPDGFDCLPDPAFYVSPQESAIFPPTFILFEAVRKNAWKSLRKIIESHPSVVSLVSNAPYDYDVPGGYHKIWDDFPSIVYDSAVNHVNKNAKKHDDFLNPLFEINHLENDIVFCFYSVIKDRFPDQPEESDNTLTAKVMWDGEEDPFSYLEPWVLSCKKREQVEKNRDEIFSHVASVGQSTQTKKPVL